MHQVTQLFEALATLFGVCQTGKLAEGNGKLAKVRIVDPGSTSPNITFTDYDDNPFYEIDATNLLADQVITVNLKYNNGLSLASLPVNSVLEIKIAGTSKMPW